MGIATTMDYGMILSIESSCDDSSIAVTEIATRKLLFHKKISQDAQHAVYGGVVPELAARLHTEALPKILEEVKPYFPHLRAIAVTNEPGLTVSLLEGVMMAKALCLALQCPMIPVNHLVGHVYSLFIDNPTHFPMSLLLVSGGHTMILEVESIDKITLVARTMDDSFGESFDKCAKMLGLPYPGGPHIENLAKTGNPLAHRFTIPLQGHKEIAFSFSGLKNAVRLATEAIDPDNIQAKADIAASFQHTATLHLIKQLDKYMSQAKPTTFAVVGGASANSYLRKELQNLCDRYKATLYLAPLAFCSDNAAMIGRAAIDLFERGDTLRYNDVEIRSRSNFN